ncbi:hypothetical protein GDO81_001003 [Engystomops pustulosus]|uniref:Secreted protein n=1 Tax=Engystomops pustulosus TaxID=76066 RepID=A0AAV7D932_ENGPU|nr:hypothetical protein GDO81_001003 [Engystomops pustulosus]
MFPLTVMLNVPIRLWCWLITLISTNLSENRFLKCFLGDILSIFIIQPGVQIQNSVFPYNTPLWRFNKIQQDTDKNTNGKINKYYVSKFVSLF